MPNYGQKDYWDNRYGEDRVPFDWLFEYKEVQPLIEYLIPDKSEELLCIGCGNAPFSPDLTSVGGYTNVLNTDISPVVIEQQQKKFPQQRWIVQDILDTKMSDNSVTCVIDKSLVDTLLCCTASEPIVEKMMSEIWRIMAPGARFISFSLHPIEEIVKKYEGQEWRVAFYHIRSNRWGRGKNRKRSTSHSMIVCDKPFKTEEGPRSLSPTSVIRDSTHGKGKNGDKLTTPASAVHQGDHTGAASLVWTPFETVQRYREPPSHNMVMKGLILNNAEDKELQESVHPIIFQSAIKLSTTDSLLYSIYNALAESSESMPSPEADELKAIAFLKGHFNDWKKEEVAKALLTSGESIDGHDDESGDETVIKGLEKGEPGVYSSNSSID